ncbi:MAG: hypothetical protein PUK83_01680 [Clostridia bacterium]|nr:hypothetical protein [Clostridia bacterium]MDY5263678.1 hypothetical protein [Eubacteriales bacterium]
MKNFIITKEQIETLRPFMPNIDELVEQDINDFLDALDEIMLDTLDENWESTADTVIIIKMFDEIYVQNEDLG